MTGRIDMESLVAYVDGELGAAELRRIEAALADDPEARRSVRELRESAALLRSAFNETLNEPVPTRVLEVINTGVAERATEKARGTSRGGSWGSPSWPWALAASLAALFIGFGGSFFFADYRIGQELARLESARDADRQARDDAVFQALEKHVSGQTVAWENPDSGSRGQVTPVRTFKNRQGQWCREYKAQDFIADTPRIRHAIACREPEGLWRTRIVLIGDK